MTMHRNSKQVPSAATHLRDIVIQNRKSEALGTYAVCSAHLDVIGAAVHEAVVNGSLLHVESTSNQVNQFGGYTGQNPEQFAAFVCTSARSAGLSLDRVLLGGDHLGPYPWRKESAAVAMEKAHGLVRACVLAGYQKIHLDASMSCGGDPPNGPDEKTIATRAAALCETAEAASRELSPDSPAPLYVVGTEVPTPGGESAAEAISITTPQHVASTLTAFKKAFEGRELNEAWERVVGLVVQPGVDFSETAVFDYDHAKARALCVALPSHPQLVYEAHSTDYQRPSHLKQLVEDHFAILKVGPWLTYAFREAVFALEQVEHEFLRGKGERLSQVGEALESAMLQNPAYWAGYYRGDEQQVRLLRRYSYSDRCRYYWHQPEVKAEINLLVENLTASPPPLSLISQFLPLEYEVVRSGALRASPSEMIGCHIRQVLSKYAVACGHKK